MYVNAHPLGHPYFCLNKQNEMKNKTKSILTGGITGFVTLAIAAGAILKLVSMPALVEIYTRIGMLSYLPILGATELILVAMFLWTRTMRIGFFLLTGYFGGAMAVELSHGMIFVAPGLILMMVWISAYLRDVSIFYSLQPSVSTSVRDTGHI